MEEHTLKGEYISVLKDGRLSYGGSQRWSDSPVLRGYGCGVIAALTCCCIWRGSGRTAGG